jgi:hypothetical protein
MHSAHQLKTRAPFRVPFLFYAMKEVERARRQWRMKARETAREGN